MSKKCSQWINIKKLQDFMEHKGWSEAMLAAKLGIDISYINRILKEERNGGGKILLGLLALTKEEGLDIYDFVNLDSTIQERLIMNEKNDQC